MSNYTQKEIDNVHDTLIDLIISCMRSGFIPHEEPKIGDWCFETSSMILDHDNCIGKLVDIRDNVHEIETLGGKIVTWNNSEFMKIPDRYMRK